MSLTDKINALTAYANEVTGESDTTLSEAVHTLADGYGQGGGDTIWNKIVDRKVTEIDDKDGVCKTIGAYAFYGCESLTSVIFPSVEYIGRDAFGNCSALSSINLPLVISAGDNTFYSCGALRSVDMPLLKSVPSYFCRSASNLLSATFSSAKSIGKQAFQSCSQLSSIDIPSATSISSNSFYSCSRLSSIDLPSATIIYSNAFSSCKALKTLVLRKSDAICTLSGSNALASTPIASGTGYIYVPASLIETYKTASQWSTYAARFRALEDYTVDGTITGDLDPNKI